MPAGKPTARGVSAESDTVAHMAWRQDGRTLGVSGTDGALRLFDVRRMEKTMKLVSQHAFSGAIGQFAWVNGGSAIVAACASPDNRGGFKVIQVPPPSAPLLVATAGRAPFSSSAQKRAHARSGYLPFGPGARARVISGTAGLCQARTLCVTRETRR